MSTIKLLARASAVALFASFLTACGGGGGGGSSGSSDSGGPDADLAVVDRNNAKQFSGGFARIANMGAEAVYYSPQLISSLVGIPGAGGAQPFDEDVPCNSGSVKISGSLNASGLGTLSLAYQNCVETDYYYSYRYTGTIHITTRAFAGTYPSAYDYRYENYRFEDLQAGTSDSYAGDFSVDAGSDGAKFSTTMTITSGGQTTKATHFKATYGSNMLPVQVTGRLEQSGLGTVALTGDNAHTFLSGRQGVLRIDSSFYFYAPVHLALDIDKDSSYDSFAWVPWESLGVQPTTNTAPTINVSNPGLEPLTNQDVTVPINGVTDAEYDLLSYSVQRLQSPDNVDIHLALQEDQSFTFRTAGPGHYVIALTVDDGRGGVTTQNIAYQVKQPVPIVPTPSGSINLTSGTVGSFSVQPGNLDAGPFTYQIVSGPSGMTIDSQGNVQWPAASAFFPKGETQAVIKVGNADHEVSVPLQFKVDDNQRSEPIVQSGLIGPTELKNVFVLDFKNDGTRRILMTDNDRQIYTLKFENGTYVQDWAYPYPIGGAISSIAPLDVDHDGNYEIAVRAGNTIHIINEAHNAIDRSVALTGLDYFYGLAVADLDNDGTDELITLGSNYVGQQGIVLNATTLAEKWRTSYLALGYDFTIGNVDNDPAREIVFAGGYVFDGATRLNQWTYGAQFGATVHAGDIDGDGVDEIVGKGQYMSDYPNAYSAASKTLLWSIVDTNTCGVGLVQLDGDAAQEVMTSDCYWGTALNAYDATASGATLKWTAAPGSYGSRNFVSGDFDTDGDIDIFMLAASSYYTPMVFDPATMSITFNGASRQFADGYSGGLKASQGGTTRVVFSAINTNAYSQGLAFLAVTPTTGETTHSPIITASLAAGGFCVADFDGDSNDDIQYGAVENYSVAYLESYDFFGQAQQWRHTTSAFSGFNPIQTSCGDFNNDGHLDIASNLNSSIAVHDPFNQTLLYSTPTNLAQPLASGDIDGDGKLEIVSGTDEQLKKYTASGSTYVEDGLYTGLAHSYWYSTKPVLSIVDIDGDQQPEIVAAVQTHNLFEPVRSLLVVLNSDLTERNRVIVQGIVRAIAPEFSRAGHVMVAISDDHYADARIAMISVATGNWVWRSPTVVGTISANNLHYDSEAGGRLMFGTSKMLYITR